MNIHTVIVTWNQTDLTLECLAALHRAGVSLGSVWLVDNGSVPAAEAAIHEHFPAVHVVRLNANSGFAGGANFGARAALDAGADALFLLNNDALVEPSTLPALAAALERDERIAAVSPKVYYAVEGRVLQSVGMSVDASSGQARMLGANEVDRGQHDAPADRDALFGCAMLIRRAAWEQVGPFWEPFFAYAEETDWCLRTRRAGWRLRYEPQAAVWHKTSSTLGWDSPLKTYLMTRNQLLLRKRHKSGGLQGLRGLAYAAYVSGRTSARYVRSGRREAARAIVLGWLDYARDISGAGRDTQLHRIDTPAQTVEQPCVVCGAAQGQVRFVVNGYTVARCPVCRFEFVAPTPGAAELAEYYARGYAVPFERYATAGQRNAGRIAELERWQPARGRLLEVGASYGHSLVAARERGWHVAGVELSPDAALYAREHFALDVANTDLLDAALPAANFDAAVLWHVLEHTRDPRAQLVRLHTLLRPGGVLGLRVPNGASIGARLAGHSWAWMHPPAHLWYFSPDTLPRLLRDCGFTVLEVRTARGDGNNIYQHALFALGSWLNNLRLRKPGNAVQRPTVQAAPSQEQRMAAQPAGVVRVWLRVLKIAQPLTDALARASRHILEPIEARGLGDELVVYARKSEPSRS